MGCSFIYLLNYILSCFSVCFLQQLLLQFFAVKCKNKFQTLLFELYFQFFNIDKMKISQDLGFNFFNFFKIGFEINKVLEFESNGQWSVSGLCLLLTRHHVNITYSVGFYSFYLLKQTNRHPITQNIGFKFYKNALKI